MTDKNETLKELAADAVTRAIKTGDWQAHPELSSKIALLGLEVIEKREEDALAATRVEAGDHIDADGWDGDLAHAWRLVLDSNTCQCCVYFKTEPDYSRVKAFAAAAGLPAAYAKVERRPDA